MPELRKKLRLGEILVQQKLVSVDQVRIALTEQKNSDLPLGRQLVKLGFITESVLRDILARTIGQESVDLANVVADGEALKLVPEEFARKQRVLPIALDGSGKLLTVAMTDMFNVVALDQLRASLGPGFEVKTVLAGEAQLQDCIDQFYGYELSVEGILRELETGEIDYQSLQAGSEEYTQPIVRLVNALLVDAVKRGSSDIHFEPEYAFLRVRYRMDGVLEQIRSLHKSHWPGIAVRLKVISGMNIAEIRAPQDGHLSLTLNGRPIDFRVATQPTIYGENIVLRVLDREKSIIPLDRIGFTAEARSTLDIIMARPEGILIVTGPTGSGKTTLLYSLLSYLNDETVNIMTLEDPVEYPVAMMRQSTVNEAVRMDFASGVRSIMRQDPDIILVGEIRDRETADMALRAAMTGHQVFTTLHTNSALGAFPRLLDIGILPDIMAGNIVGVTGQRLVRLLCPHCKQAYMPNDTERQILGLAKDDERKIYRAAGCPQCQNKGYKGRMALIELLRMDSELDDLVAHRATAREMRALAVSKGFKSLAEDGVRRIMEGLTTLYEVSRVIDLTGRLH